MTTTHRTTTGAALVLALAAAGASGASASPIRYSHQDKAVVSSQSTAGQPSGMYSRQDKSLAPEAAQPRSGPATAANASSPQPVVRVVTSNNGFDWGDAGIGAAGGLALSMIGLGGALVSQRRTRRAHESTALTS